VEIGRVLGKNIKHQLPLGQLAQVLAIPLINALVQPMFRDSAQDKGTCQENYAPFNITPDLTCGNVVLNYSTFVNEVVSPSTEIASPSFPPGSGTSLGSTGRSVPLQE